jgi:2-phosphosulfolactate phosphatase
MKTLDVLVTPAEFTVLPQRDLSQTVCVVFDVLRATSSIVTALANGAAAVIPVREISEALAWRQKLPDVLLAGERDGVRILGRQSGGIDFDLGNSPREYTAEKVRGKTIVTTTTNGTWALRSCAAANKVLIGSFLNLTATVRELERLAPDQLLLIGAGTYEQSALEDILAAGAVNDLVWRQFERGHIGDSALMARELYRGAKSDLLAAACQATNARRLLANPDLRDDVAYCLRRDVYDFAVEAGRDSRLRLVA